MLLKKNIIIFILKIINIIKRTFHLNCLTIGSPLGYYYSISDYKSSGSSEIELFKINEKQAINLSRPKSVYENTHWLFDPPCPGILSESSEGYISILKNCRVIGINGSIVTSNDYLLFDVSIDFNLDPLKHFVFHLLRFPKVSCIYGKTLILSASGGNNYYHWLFDILPRFFFFEKADFHISEIDQILMPYGSLAFQDEMLNIIGIPKEKVIPLEENSHFITEKLYLPSLAGISGNTPEWICKYLRNKINAALPDATCVTPQKIYISRKNAKYRKVINEEEVVFFLKSKGFEVIYSENYSFYEQVQIFQKARIIVAPHGAGLSNIVFCRSGTKIIECFDNNYINQCYWTIASHCRLDYYYIISNQSFERKYMVDVKKDIYIPVNELMETLNFATNQSN